MFLGHYGPALALRPANSRSRVRLWHLFVAVQFMDILWSVLVLLHIEKVRIIPGFMAASSLDLYYMPFTHGLPGSIAISVVAGALFTTWSKRIKDGVIIAIGVFSHWILDLIVHTRDLPLWDNHYKVGFGLWNHLALSLIVEFLVFALGGLIYVRRMPGTALRVTIVGVAVGLVQVWTIFGPQGMNAAALAITALVLYVVIALTAVWIERGSTHYGVAGYPGR